MKTCLSKFILISSVFLLSNDLLFSQKESEVSVGFGFPDMFNLKFKRGIYFQRSDAHPGSTH